MDDTRVVQVGSGGPQVWQILSAWPSMVALRGGYTTLAALTFRDVFTAGCSLRLGLWWNIGLL